MEGVGTSADPHAFDLDRAPPARQGGRGAPQSRVRRTRLQAGESVKEPGQDTR